MKDIEPKHASVFFRERLLQELQHRSTTTTKKQVTRHRLHGSWSQTREPTRKRRTDNVAALRRSSLFPHGTVMLVRVIKVAFNLVFACIDGLSRIIIRTAITTIREKYSFPGTQDAGPEHQAPGSGLP